MLAPACRGRVPELAPLPPLSIEKVPQRALQRVRVLLTSNYASVIIRNAGQGESVTVFSFPNRLVLVDTERGQEMAEASGFRFEPVPGRLIQLEGISYRGVLEAFLNPLGQPVVVNELPLEDYLLGVVPNELGPKAFPQLAALEAQSVAARTYALARRGRFAAEGFDMHSDERSQVYRGLLSEQPLSDQAVNSTTGRIALFDGRPIEAYYSSTCGGLTASYQDVFRGEPIPYLGGGVACPDQEGRYHRWAETILISSIRESLQVWVGVGRLSEVLIEQRDATGRATAIRFRGERGEAVVDGLSFRRALGLRSHFVERLEVDRDSDGWVTRFRVQGRGFGHGVGLCQIGAVEWARRGRSYQEILETYYPGIAIARLY